MAKPQGADKATPFVVDGDGLTEVELVRGSFTTGLDDKGQPLSFGPGSTVKVNAEDKAMLERLGFIRGSDYVAPDEVQDGAMVVPADGPSVSAA